jgi:hypothetical protein
LSWLQRNGDSLPKLCRLQRITDSLPKLSWLQRNCDSLPKLWRQQRNSFSLPAAKQFSLPNWAACSEPVLAVDFYNKPPRQK